MTSEDIKHQLIIIIIIINLIINHYAPGRLVCLSIQTLGFYEAIAVIICNNFLIFLNVSIQLAVCRCLGYLHQVRSYGRSLSLTVLFASVPSFQDDGCALMEEEFRPLSDAVFTWTFAEGQRVSCWFN